MGDANCGSESDGTWAGWVYAVDADTGVWKWRLKSNYPIVGGMTPTAGGVVFVGDAGGNFYALDTATGEKLWGQQLGGAVGGVCDAGYAASRGRNRIHTCRVAHEDRHTQDRGARTRGRCIDNPGFRDAVRTGPANPARSHDTTAEEFHTFGQRGDAINTNSTHNPARSALRVAQPVVGATMAPAVPLAGRLGNTLGRDDRLTPLAWRRLTRAAGGDNSLSTHSVCLVSRRRSL
jgi:PQQ-like domain